MEFEISFFFLLSRESLLMSVTKCMCLGRPLAPGSDRAWSIIYFITTFIPNNHVITTFWDALLFSLPFDNVKSFVKDSEQTDLLLFFCKTNYRIFFLMYHYINTTLYIHNYRMSFLVADACLIAGATNKM